MNNLPEPILDNIYKYKHQLEFRHVMDQLIGSNDDTMHLSSKAFIRYLKRNIDEIECIILSDSSRMCVVDYLNAICKNRNKIFN